MTERPTLREEFRQWWKTAPRVWVIIGAIVVSAFVFRGTLDLVASAAFILLLLLVLISIIPAIIGALAGKLVGGVIRRVRYPRDARTYRVPLVLPRRHGSR